MSDQPCAIVKGGPFCAPIGGPVCTPIDSEAFFLAYHKALAGIGDRVERVATSRTEPGSFGDLLRRYYSAPEFLNLADGTQRNYRRILEKFGEKHRDWPVSGLKRIHIKTIIGKMEDRPQAANSLLKRLKTLLNFAAEIDMVPHNPLMGMRGLKVSSEGFHTWTDEEISRYEARHPIGSKARLAMALMLFTGQRKSDAVKMGWQHVKDGRIAVRQQKTTTMVDIPIHPDLKRVLDGSPRKNLTFLVTEYGKPFTANGFGNWMRDRCNEAGLPQCSSHGLRKAMAKRLAEAGCSVNEIMSITGHATEGEVIRYTKEANKTVLADHAMRALQLDGARRKSANPVRKVSKSDG
ncbi:hypothetical protein CDQ91_06680 [Sphingopyxis witflariensis]|uniref:Tyr recombinase domain-containing protein n=1 Tax=Sphingopyxis witflariensis TaxID=173675 RepID=A0A246JZB6_9SPHN|nr:hypothetical protein CDQ91_06680 [Sphingopyxis witflariensis]